MKTVDLDKIDVMVTHTVPSVGIDDVCKACQLQRDWLLGTVSEDNLQLLFERLPRVRDWYFGHWHQTAEFTVPRSRVNFHMLNMTPYEGCLRGKGYSKKRLARVEKEYMERLEAERQPRKLRRKRCRKRLLALRRRKRRKSRLRSLKPRAVSDS